MISTAITNSTADCEFRNVDGCYDHPLITPDSSVETSTQDFCIGIMIYVIVVMYFVLVVVHVVIVVVYLAIVAVMVVLANTRPPGQEMTNPDRHSNHS